VGRPTNPAKVARRLIAGGMRDNGQAIPERVVYFTIVLEQWERRPTACRSMKDNWEQRVRDGSQRGISSLGEAVARKATLLQSQSSAVERSPRPRC
jgi:hypothetical protein